MPDVLTTVLELNKQTIGGNDNTWGGILNDNLEIIENVIAGMETIAVNGGTDTLTDDQCRNRILNFTGTLGSNQIIEVPNLVSVWFVVNACTLAGFTLTFKTSGGSASAAIPVGRGIVWCDGNDVCTTEPGSSQIEAQLLAAAGTVSLPGWSFAADPDSGVYRIGANNLGLAVNGSKILDVNTSGLAITGDLSVSDDCIFSDDVLISGDLTVNLTTTFTGAVTGAAATFTGLVTLSSTSHMLPPSGTTAQRPASQVEGRFRYNSDLNVMEFDDGVAWRQWVVAPPLRRSFAKLIIANKAGNENTQLLVTADGVVVQTSDGVSYRSGALSITINAGTTGAGGLDASDTSLGASAWYYVHILYNPSTDAWTAMLSTNASAPVTTPAGYTASDVFGAFKTNSSNNLLRMRQIGKDAQYVLIGAAGGPNYPIMISGSSGNPTTGPSLTAQAVAAFVPSAAGLCAKIKVLGFGATSVITIAGPNDQFGVYNSTSNPPPMGLYTGSSGNTAQVQEWVLEGDNVYYASGGSGAGLACMGFTLNL